MSGVDRPPPAGGWRRRSVLVLLQSLMALPWLARMGAARPLPRPPDLVPADEEEAVFEAGVFEAGVFR